MRWLLVLLPLVAACGEHEPVSIPLQPALVNKATRQKVVSHVEWSAQAVRQNCKSDQDACTRREQDPDGTWHATYYMPAEPHDFNDVPQLARLGHECWHGFGANHQ